MPHGGSVNYVCLHCVKPSMAMSTVAIHILGDVPSSPLVGILQVYMVYMGTSAAKKQTLQSAAWTRQEEESFFIALQQVASSIETSVVAAENVARLILSRSSSQVKSSSSNLKSSNPDADDLHSDLDDALPDGTELAYFVRGNAQKVIRRVLEYFAFAAKVRSALLSLKHMRVGLLVASLTYTSIHQMESLYELSLKLSQLQKLSAEENDDLCSICADGVDLLCCDNCPRAFHPVVFLYLASPSGTWYCKYCENMFQKEKFVERNANVVAARRITGIDPLEQITKRCIHIVETTETDVGGCALCRGHGFSKLVFGPQTVILYTFPLGCAFDESIVHHKYFEYNLDSKNSTYSTKNGIYSEGYELDNVMISWGHDDYMYLVAKEHGTTLPPAALFIIRYHSFYPLHKSGAYTHLMNADDVENLKWLKIFNKYDLYSKNKVRIDVEKVKPYYLSLIEKVNTTLVRKLVFPSQAEMVNIPN
ncbi:unnamed protein product [Camellia sinensis]